MEEKMGESSFTIDAIGPDDVMPEAVISKLISTVVIDGDKHDISVKALIEALEEEQEAIGEWHANKDRRKKQAEELFKQRVEAEAAAKAEAERLEAAEKERLAK